MSLRKTDALKQPTIDKRECRGAVGAADGAGAAGGVLGRSDDPDALYVVTEHRRIAYLVAILLIVR